MSETMLEKILLKVIEMDEKINNLPNIFVTKEEFHKAMDHITTSFDHFTRMYERLDLEILSVRSKNYRLEDRVENIESKLGLES